MKRMMKRTAVAALAGVMAAGLLAGCGQKTLDGTKTVATVDGEEISMGLVSLVARQQQAQMEAMYSSFMGQDYDIWSQPAMEDSEMTYGEQMVEDVLKQVEIMYLMKAKAADYEVEITEEDQTAIDEAAAAFMADNSEETIAELAVTEDQVKQYLELETYRERVYNGLMEEAAIEITDEEAQQSAFTYVSVSTSGEDLTDEDIEAKKEQAQEILDQMKEDPEADMDEIAQAVDESYSALEGTFTTNPSEDEDESGSSYPEEVIEVLRELEEGEAASELIETENSYYVVRLDSEFDEEATESKKESIKSTKEYEYYTEVTEGWLEEAEIEVEDKVLKELTITDSHTFTLETVTDEEALEEEGTEELEDAEIIDDEGMEDVEVLEDEMTDEMEDAEIIDEEIPEDADGEEIGELEDSETEIIDESQADTELDLDAQLDE